MKTKKFLSKVFCFPLALMMGIPDSGGGTGDSKNSNVEGGGNDSQPKTFTQEEVTELLAAEKTKGKMTFMPFSALKKKTLEPPRKTWVNIRLYWTDKNPALKRHGAKRSRKRQLAKVPRLKSRCNVLASIASVRQ